MRDRADRLRAELALSSAPLKGTTLRLVVPLGRRRGPPTAVRGPVIGQRTAISARGVNVNVAARAAGGQFGRNIAA